MENICSFVSIVGGQCGCYCQLFSGFTFPFEPLVVSFALLSLVFVVLPRRCLSRLMYDLQTKKSIIFCIS